MKKSNTTTVIAVNANSNVIAEIMKQIGNKICRIESMKKDGTYTVRSGRFGVKNPKHTKKPDGTGKTAKQVVFEQNCIPFFDMNAKVKNGGKGDYRKFCIPNLISIECGNIKYQF
jgi:hypothetical protein